MNDRIRAQKIVVIDEQGENLGLINTQEALNIARERELDLVLVSPNLENPVAKIVDWSKFKYEKSKKLRKNKGKTLETKEWWFKPNIGDRDIDLKLENVRKYLKKGGTAKLTIKYVQKTPYEMLKSTFDRVAAKAQEFAKPLGEAAKEGRNISILVKLQDKKEEEKHEDIQN